LEVGRWNLLVTLNATLRALLQLVGSRLLPDIECQLLPFAQMWLTDDSDTAATAASVTLIAAIVEAGGVQHAHLMLQTISDALSAAESGESAAGGDELTQAAAYAVGVLAQHGGDVLSAGALAAASAKLMALLGASAPSVSRAASEQAAAAVGKLLMHRAGAVDAAALVPLWLAWLPLRTDEEEGRASLGVLCNLLGTEEGLRLVLGQDGHNLPRVLTVMAAASESSDAGEEVSARLRSVLQSWRASHPTLLQACHAALPALSAVARDKLERMGLKL
jgi:hypothetical protein